MREVGVNFERVENYAVLQEWLEDLEYVTRVIYGVSLKLSPLVQDRDFDSRFK